MGWNYIHELAHEAYPKNVYNATVADTFLEDELFGADMTIPIKDRDDIAVKRVQKLSAASIAVVEETGRGGNSATRRGGAGRRVGIGYNRGGRPFFMQPEIDHDYRPSVPSSFDRFSGGSYGHFGGSGNIKDNGQRTCSMCGSTWHQAKQYPNT
jgi:hypothetical protein